MPGAPKCAKKLLKSKLIVQRGEGNDGGEGISQGAHNCLRTRKK